jgi:bifunctional non-homologous end joining protein LigD
MSSKQRYKPGKSAFSTVPSSKWTDIFPDFIEPCHPTQRPKSPSGERWVHEIKVDGYRLQLHLWHGAVTAYTRRGNDWSARFRTIVEAAKTLPVKEAIIDGEVIVATPEGLSDFGALQEDLGAGRSDRLTYFAFDLLYVDGYDLLQSPLLARKEALKRVLEGGSSRFLYSEHVADDGAKVHARGCAMGIEGIVSKLVDSPYRSGRSESWIKATCRKRDTFVVVGFVPAPTGSLKALYLGRREGGELLYAGKAGTGFTGETARMLRERLDPIGVRKSPLSVPVKKPKAKWVKPEVLADIEYRSLTDDGRMRHGSFKGVREDLMQADEAESSRPARHSRDQKTA